MKSANGKVSTQQEISPGTVLVSHTLVTQASLATVGVDEKTEALGFDYEYEPTEHSPLVSRPTGRKFKRPLFDSGFFFDLVSVIEAVVLHDQLIVLSARIDPVYTNLPLRRRLVQEGILYEADTPLIDPTQVVDGLVSLGTLRDPLERYDLLVEGHYLEGWFELEKVGRADYPDTKPRQESTNVALLRIATANGYNAYFDGILTRHAGIDAEGSFLLRTVLYWLTSERLKISYYPDFLRVPLVCQLTSRLRRSLTREVYHQLASSFQVSVQELVDSNAPFDLAIPPLAALILNRCSRPEEIVEALLEMRDEFASLRKAFRGYEERLRYGRTLKDQLEARREVTEIAERLAKSYEPRDLRAAQASLNYLEKGIAVASNPVDFKSYSADLILQPIEQLREWWIRRRAIHLFRMKKKLDGLQDFGNLVQKVYGRSLSDQEVEEYRAFSHHLEELLYPVHGA